VQRAPSDDGSAEPWRDLPWPVEETQRYLRRVAPRVDASGRWLSKAVGGAIVWLLRRLSWENADRLGSLIGWILATLRVRRDIALVNLDVAYGERKTRAEKLAIYRASMLGLGRHLLNYARTPLMDAEFFRTRFEIEDEERLREVMARGKGLLVVGGHLGEWEIAAARVGMLGYPASMIAKRIRSPVIEKFLIDARLAINLGTMFASGSMDQILDALRRGEMITMAVDQNMRASRGVFVDWMGRPASTVRSTAYVVRETGASVLTGVAYRVAPGRFKLVVGEEVPWEPHPQDAEEELLINTRHHAKAVERLIYAYPETWLWVHRRYKVQPDGVPSPYPDDARRARRRAASGQAR